MKVYIGIDAHSTNYTLRSYNSEADDCTNAVTLKPEYEGIVKYAEKIKNSTAQTPQYFVAMKPDVWAIRCTSS